MKNETILKERAIEIDFLKGIAILLVIFGHVVQYSLTEPYENPLFNFIYSFHMPLFVYISGFLSYKDVCSINDIKKRAYQLLIPFLLWPLIKGFLFNGSVSIDDYILLFKDPTQGLWFLWILFLISSFFTLVGVLINKVGGGKKYVERNSQYVLFASVLLAYVLAGILFKGEYGMWLFSLYIIYYFGGWVTRRYYTIFKPLLREYWYLFLASFVVLSFFWEFNHHPTFLESPSKLISILYNYLTGFAGSLALFSICLKFVKQKPDSKSFVKKQIVDYGKMTLGLYAIHLSILVNPVVERVGTLNIHIIPSILLSFVITLLLSLLLYHLLNCGVLTRLLLGKMDIK